ncbi:MAG: molybdenum cofactor biosynthesis enzyme [Coriobacteriia bacterium]|nr:molybdenum cofactor biosynthesis enzyme [Coriobacteriia bacterium]
MKLYEKDGGYSTFGMVVALLLTLSLVFTGAQVYRVTSASAAIQDVADAAALAAENQVAEFMIAVRVSDAVVLSLTLTSLTATGLGVAALCTPVTAPLSEALLSAGKTVMNARNSFATKAADALNSYQKILPFLASANASRVARSNESGTAGSSYTTLALLLPGSGEDISVGTEQQAEQVQQEADQQADDIRDAANRAEEAAKKANAAKLNAYNHDCGLNPGYCMYQRAETLAGMGGSRNPFFSSVDNWSFVYALDRAKAYYSARLAGEGPDSSTVADGVRSALRRDFYEYAVDQMRGGYVHETADTFSAYFPTLPRNTSEMRETYLYTQVNYPVTVDGAGVPTMHAWQGCPSAAGTQWWGSIEDMESGGYDTCPDCEFSAASMGRVASASTSISNGFEYHYVIVAQEAENYQAAKEEMQPAAQEVKDKAQSLFDKVMEALKEAANKRIKATPPGSDGAIVLVADRGASDAGAGFETSFVSGSSTLGTRAAVSASTLLADDSEETKTVLNGLLDNVRDQGGILTGALGLVLDCWSALLKVYTGGQDAITDAIESAVSTIPFASESGLGKWASKQFKNAVKSLGLQPAKLESLRPVLVNSGYVAGECDEAVSVGFLAAKQAALSTGEEGGVFGAVLGYVKYAALGKLNDKFEIATIKPLGENGPSIPLTITLPAAAQDAAGNLIDQAIAQLRAATVGQAQVGTWN